MKKSLYFICFLSTAVAALVTSEVAAQSKNNWYNKFYVRGDVGAFIPANKFKSRDDDDPYATKMLKQTAIYNIGIGYKITDCIRSDLNFSYRNLQYKALDSDNNTMTQKIKSYSIFLNGYFDFININKMFKPYLTAGVGYGNNKTSDLVEVQATTNIETGRFPGVKKRNFIWNVGLGTRFIINDTFNLDATYRYIDLGKIKTKDNIAPFASPEELPAASQRLKAHEITCGVIIHL